MTSNILEQFGSFRPEVAGRIGVSGFQDLVTDGQQGDEQGAATCECEDPPVERGSIAEVLQPVVHGKPGYRRCDEHGEAHQPEAMTNPWRS